MRSLRLQIRDHGGVYICELADEVVDAGRDETCGLRLAHPKVSRRHGRFSLTPTGWQYRDNGSSNGSRLNGTALAAHQWVPLAEGDVLAMGAVDATVLPPTEPTTPGPPAVAAAGDGRRELDVHGVLSIGRALDNDLVIADPHVSSYHLEARLSATGVRVRDLESRNGTWLRDQRVGEVELGPADTLRLGPHATLRAADLIARLRANAMPAPPPSDHDYLLVGRGLGRTVGRKKVILRDVDIAVRRGEFCAVVGSAGAGKSTLIKILNGYTPYQSGQLLRAPDPTGGREMGYVPQDDIIHRDLPLRDAVVLSAMVRFPPGTTKQQVTTRADEVLAELGITEQARTLVSQLSGGQRKRASVALELMTRPKLLLLDEATTGLDPANERRLMLLFRSLADSGIGVLMITHATANISLCDDVSIVARGGHLVFRGTPEEAKAHFEVTSFDDVYDRLEGGGTPEEWRERFVRSEAYRTLQARVAEGSMALAATPPPVAVPVDQARLLRWQSIRLSLRYLRTLRADRRNLAFLLAQVPAIMLLARSLFASNTLLLSSNPATLGGGGQPAAIPGSAEKSVNLLFILALLLVWVGTFNAAREICKEAAIWQRERHLGVRPMAYVASKVVVLVGLCAVQTLSLVLLFGVLWTVPGGRGTLVGLFVAGLCAAFCGVAVGLALSALVPTPDRAVALVPLVTIPQLMFGGGVIPLRDMGPFVEGLSAMVAARWAFSAFANLTNRIDYLPQGSRLSDQVAVPWIVSIIVMLALSALFTGLAVWLVGRGNTATVTRGGS